MEKKITINNDTEMREEKRYCTFLIPCSLFFHVFESLYALMMMTEERGGTHCPCGP